MKISLKAGVLAVAAAMTCAAVPAGAAVMTVTTASPGWEVSTDQVNWVPPVVTATYQPGGFSVPALWTSILIGSNETRYFRYSFDLPGTPGSATLHLAQDDDIDFAINGQTVYTDDNGVAGGSPALDVLAQLHPGINHIDVQLVNTQCCGAGLGVHLDITFEPRAGVPEPATLLLMGAGLAGLGLGASRRRSRPV